MFFFKHDEQKMNENLLDTSKLFLKKAKSKV
jgi:hypothetical protein